MIKPGCQPELGGGGRGCSVALKLTDAQVPAVYIHSLCLIYLFLIFLYLTITIDKLCEKTLFK